MADLELTVGLDTQEYDRKIVAIQSTTNQVTKATAKYDRELRRLKNQFKNSKISVQQFSAAKRELNRDLAAFKLGIVNAGNEFKNYSNYARAATAATQRSTKSINSAGLMMQQTGYQVGDFLVQVQSGTNAMVAFGQQATQVAGTLTLLGGRMVIIGSVLGVAIPLITAVGAAWMRTRDSAKGASDELKQLESDIKGIDSAIRDFLLSQEALSKGLSVDELISENELDRTIEKVAKLDKQIADTQNRLKNIGTATGFGNIFGITTGTIGLLTEQIILNERLKGAEKEREEALERIRELQNKIADEQQRTFDKALGSLGQEIDLLKVKLKFGQDSAAARAKEVEQAIKNYNAQIDKQVELNELTKPQAEILKNAFEQAQNLSLQLGNSADNANILAGNLQAAMSALNGLSSFSLNLDRQISTASARVEALKSGADATVAGRVATQRAQLEQRVTALQDNVDPGMRGAIRQTYQSEFDKINRLESLLTEESGIRASNRGSSKSSGGGGSSGAAKETAEDYLNKLQKEVEYKQKLVGLNEQEQRVQEIIFQMKEKGFSVDEKRVQQIAAIEEQTRKLIEAEQQREALIGAVENNIESMLMSIVDGTSSVEDAFKGMLRNIILEIYKQQVAKPFAESSGNFISAIFKSLTKSTKYADGGIVDSPTFFGMKGGNTGLMGEAGPEAILPLRRGKNGQLGVQVDGGGNEAVYVTQNFNIAANGDESVRRIVAEEAPKISRAAQAELMDRRRRGGQVRAVFGSGT